MTGAISGNIAAQPVFGGLSIGAMAQLSEMFFVHLSQIELYALQLVDNYRYWKADYIKTAHYGTINRLFLFLNNIQRKRETNKFTNMPWFF